jgi:site-specific recombinase XerD
LLIDQKADRTIIGYSRTLADISLYFNRTPENLNQEELDDYLAKKVRGKISTFKHVIHGLRYYYNALEIDKALFRLPVVKKPQHYPSILNSKECKRLFRAPASLRDRLILCLMYSAGLRSCELRALQVKDIDSERMLIHIRESKNHKDRYVPLSRLILCGLRRYWKQEKPKDYLFPGRKNGCPMSSATIAQMLRKAVAQAGILKRVSPHTLRHTYASHLLEMGTSILRVKELLGHTDIRTTMLYLRVINLSEEKDFSPFDKLYCK